MCDVGDLFPGQERWLLDDDSSCNCRTTHNTLFFVLLNQYSAGLLYRVNQMVLQFFIAHLCIIYKVFKMRAYGGYKCGACFLAVVVSPHTVCHNKQSYQLGCIERHASCYNHLQRGIFIGTMPADNTGVRYCICIKNMRCVKSERRMSIFSKERK